MAQISQHGAMKKIDQPQQLQFTHSANSNNNGMYNSPSKSGGEESDSKVYKNLQKRNLSDQNLSKSEDESEIGRFMIEDEYTEEEKMSEESEMISQMVKKRAKRRKYTNNHMRDRNKFETL